MCGIFAYLSRNKGKITMNQRSKIIQSAVKSQHRGPDTTNFVTYDDTVCLCFHRLAIMDKSKKGDQPLSLHDKPDQILICNGEIYNFKLLAEQHGFELESGSDCEIILHMIDRFGIAETLKQLDGVFAFVYYDKATETFHVARDPYGVRALYIGLTRTNNLVFSSELKSMDEIVRAVPSIECFSKLAYVLYDFQVRTLRESQLTTKQIRRRNRGLPFD